jgi:arylsulfatase
MALLRELGLDRDTVVLFTSDNGTTHLAAQVDYQFFNSTAGLRGLKGSLYEGGIRVPMLARWPGKIEAGTTSALAAAGYDMFATIAELGGTAASDDTDGISFAAELVGKNARQERHDYLFWDFAGYGGQLAVRRGRWKGIKTNIRNAADALLELYNLEENPGETRNVAVDFPNIARDMEHIMLEARTKPDVDRFVFGEYGA